MKIFEQLNINVNAFLDFKIQVISMFQIWYPKSISVIGYKIIYPYVFLTSEGMPFSSSFLKLTTGTAVFSHSIPI